jgi:hypothetical protein
MRDSRIEKYRWRSRRSMKTLIQELKKEPLYTRVALFKSHLADSVADIPGRDALYRELESLLVEALRCGRPTIQYSTRQAFDDGYAAGHSAGYAAGFRDGEEKAGAAYAEGYADAKDAWGGE